MRYRLLICDLDGTLVDSEPIANRILAERLAALGVPLTFEEADAAFTGLSLPLCFDLVRQRWGIEVPEGFDASLQDETFALLRRELKPMPGAAEALARIDGAKCVASSSEMSKIRLELDVAGLRPFFGDALFSARDVARPKPAPDVYLHTARAMGVMPADCAAVEDSAPGIAAALAAGMTVFGYRAGPQPGITPFADWRDLPDLLA